MNPILLESPPPPPTTPTTVNNPNSIHSHSYDSLLRESAERFLSELRHTGSDTGNTSAAELRTVSLRLLSSSPDPPLEATWLHAAISFHSQHQSGGCDLISLVNDLFNFFVSCSAFSNRSKSIALLAPVVSHLFHVLSDKDYNLKKNDVELVLERVLGYISICCSKSGEDKFGSESCSSILGCFFDVGKVWAAGLRKISRGLDENNMRVLFPMVSEEIRSGLLRKDGSGVGCLARVVIAEVFLMRLCLKVQAAGSGTEAGLRSELQKELRIWAVSSMTVFQDRVLFEILLRLLLAPALPVIPFLGAKDENAVRDILYDALILVDYSFLNSGLEVEQSHDHLASLPMRRLAVSHEAIGKARAKRDYAKAASYTNAFATSYLPHFLVKWVMRKVGTGSTPAATTPEALLRWLVSLEERLTLFGDDILELLGKLIFAEPRVPELRVKSGNKILDDEFMFDKQANLPEDTADDNEMEMNSAFQTAAQSMKILGNGRKKRKEHGAEVEMQGKQIKYKLQDCSVNISLSRSTSDDSSSGSEVEDPDSDDDMEDIVH